MVQQRRSNLAYNVRCPGHHLEFSPPVPQPLAAESVTQHCRDRFGRWHLMAINRMNLPAVQKCLRCGKIWQILIAWLLGVVNREDSTMLIAAPTAYGWER